MSLFNKIYKILYPFIIWVGTLMIPSIVTLLLLWIFTEDFRSKEDLEFLWTIIAVGFAVSIPAVILFAIVYYICLLIRSSNKFTKRVLHITNFINIIVSVGWIAGTDFGFGMALMLVGLFALLLPSALLITFLKIPKKKIV